MKDCYLSRNYKGIDSAGNKAKTDIEEIMSDIGFQNVGLPQTTYNNKIASFVLTLAGVLKAPFGLGKGDNLVLQYPLKKYFVFLCNMAHMRGAKVITLIHDLGSFRRKALTIEKEIWRLNHSDYIIAHNEVMKQWLIDHGCKAKKIGVLEIFDFFSNAKRKEKTKVEKPFKVVYAGALAQRKNAFLYEVGNYINNYKFELYGSGFDKEKAAGSEHIEYKGFVKADKLIATVDADFGLVWDGSSVDTCSGNFGEYLQYNNPHKTSLYLRCGLPVIIWKKAAMARFIEQNRIGICIDSLKELDDILGNLTTEQYMEMIHNLQEISMLIGNGYYAQAAIEDAAAWLTEKRWLREK